MSPRKLIITDEDILYAEKILLLHGKHFDLERRDFIKNLDNIDLQAVPGSGKTTALLAKLLILEKYLPFSDGSGILVISHTNNAVNEIRKKLLPYCPKLFSSPNFVGTIQSFVDEFMAIPFYKLTFKQKITIIDHERYIKKSIAFSNKSFPGFSREMQNKVKHYLRVTDIASSFRFAFINDEFSLVSELNGKPLIINKPRGRTRPENYNDYTVEEKKAIEKWLKEFKTDILREGILHFDDAYFLAEYYIHKYPPIIKILQKRFCFVFVDEMQDMEKHQYDLLEKLFSKKKTVRHVYQRIGDTNQAIYSNGSIQTVMWSNTKRKKLVLRGSYRLSLAIADVVKNFGLDFIEIEGRNTQTNIKPHIIVYDNQSISKTLDEFADVIHSYSLENILNHSFMAIGWRKDNSDPTKITIKSYFNDFNKVISPSKNSTELNSMRSFLIFNSPDKVKGLKQIMTSLLNAFLQILKIENISDEKGKAFNKSSLLAFLKNKSIADKSQIHSDFSKNIYLWSSDIYKNKIDTNYEAIKEYIPIFLKYFGDYSITNSENFINSESVNNIEVPSIDALSKSSNMFVNENGIKISIDTVHAVKGQTHTAILYLETSTNGDYESVRLIKCLEGAPHGFSPRADRDIYKKKSIKVMYVGFSRPTDLLCFAIHKNRFESLDISLLDKWIIKKIYEA